MAQASSGLERAVILTIIGLWICVVNASAQECERYPDMALMTPPKVSYPSGCENCGEMNRSHLKAFISEDEGLSWTGGLMLDGLETVSYPDGTESEDGHIFVVYGRNRYSDKEFWMAVFTERDVNAESYVTKTCRLRVTVSNPGG